MLQQARPTKDDLRQFVFFWMHDLLVANPKVQSLSIVPEITDDPRAVEASSGTDRVVEARP